MSTTDAGRLTNGKPGNGTPRSVSLQEVMESPRRLDELSCARIVGNLAEAAHAARRSGQSVSALPPSAIVVSPDGRIQLTAAAPSTRYTAPEKLRGGSADRRTDVFTLGVILWEALTHERLFDGADDAAIRRAVLDAAFRPPSELNANVPAELDAICRRALARDPVDRYPSAKVMAAEIDAVLGDAGYPESNEQIASFVAAMAAPVIAPRPAASVVPRASTEPPTKHPRPATEPPARQPRAATEPPAYQPRAATQPPTRSSVGSSSHGDTLPPPLVARQTGQTPARGAPNLAAAPLQAAPASQAAPAILLPSTTLLPSIAESPPAARPSGMAPRPAATEILGSLPAAAEKPAVAAPEGHRARSADAAPAAVARGNPGGKTAFLGSNASDDASSTAGAPSSPLTAALLAATAPAPSPAEPKPGVSYAPPAMPAPIAATRPPAPTLVDLTPPFAEPPDIKHTLLGTFTPSHHGPKPSIATAETVQTPELPAQLAVPLETPQLAAQLAVPVTQLGMPPGITVSPASPAAPLQSTDADVDELGEDPHADSAAVVSLPRTGTGGRDVLAGWGWSTDSVQAISDDDDFAEVARASRKRLILAIGGALAGVIIIAIIAFAFSGSKPPEQDSQAARGPSATAPAPTRAAEPAGGSAAPTAAAIQSGSAASATAQPPPPAAAPEPPTPSPAPSSAPPPSAELPAAPSTATEPPKAAAAPPRPEPAAEPPPPVTTKVIPEPPKAPPAKVAEPPKPPPAKVAEPPKPRPAKVAAITEPEPARKPAAKKPSEPRKPDKTIKRPPPERIARAPKAQPIDPYAAPTTPDRAPDRAPDKAIDPAAAYKTGLQQFARGDTAGALSTFRTSASSNPTFAPTWRGLGLVYEKLGNKGQARAAFKRYLQLAPGAGDADQVRDRLERLGS